MVVAIIALLVAILLPSLQNARRQAKKTVCLGNVRQLSIAIAAYTTEQRRLPYSGVGNDGNPFHPNGATASIGSPLGVSGATVLPPIGFSLQTYMGTRDFDTKYWSCPAAPALNVNADLAQGPVRGQVHTGQNPLTGFAPDDRWYSNYFYMGTQEYTAWIPSGDTSSAWRGDQWIIRNIAGLDPDTIRPVRVASPSQIVAFLDEKSLFHAPFGRDVYALGPGETDNYYASYAFIDGHAEGRKYRNLDTYLAQLHPGIPQKQYHALEIFVPREYREAYAASYDVTYHP